MKEYLLFIDAETDGLYGSFLTVAMVVVEEVSGRVIEEVYYGVRREHIQVTDEWTRNNVLPRLGNYTICEDEEDLLERTWQFWSKYRERAHAVADVAYPVETRLFEKCVRKKPQERMFQAPYPLLDISTILYWKGVEAANAEGKNLGGERYEADQHHNALYDAKATMNLWIKLKEEMGRKNE